MNAQTAIRPSIRDLMAAVALAERARRIASHRKFADADDAYLDAHQALIDSLCDLTGLERREVIDLGEYLA